MAFNHVQLDPSAGTGKKSPIVIARVKNIVLSPYIDNNKTINPDYTSPSDLGKIKYEVVYENKQINKSTDSARSAWPIFSFVKQYPLIGELVMIVQGPSPDMNDDRNSQRPYYFPPYQVWNSPNNNVFPEMIEYFEFIKSVYTKPGYQYNETGSLLEYPKGVYFQERPIKNITPFEGDSIIEGRYGQSIRFGSTATLKKTENTWSNSGTDGSPITIIRNGQGKDTRVIVQNPSNVLVNDLPDQPTVENINYDSSSIYLTSGQQIVIEGLNYFSFDSYGIQLQTQIDNRVVFVQTNPIANESTSAAENDKF